MFQEEERFRSDKEKADFESDFELVFDLDIPTGTPEQKAHRQAHDEMIRERNRKALSDPEFDTDLRF